MLDREKLIELVTAALCNQSAEEVADHLIANGVVPVVRCKDCKNFGHNLENDTYCRCVGGLPDPEDNDFCSYGERREGE